MTADAFTEFVTRAQTFYGALAKNNSKDWFEPRKDAWKADIEGPAKLLGEIMAEEISRISGVGHTPKLFRIYRDVRFSKDKSPYKTMLAMLWSSNEPKGAAPSFYFGIEPDRVFLGSGIPDFDKDRLLRYRAMVDSHGDELTDIVDASGGALINFGPDPLKRVPKPYDQDHPYAELLKRKSLGVGLTLPDDWQSVGLISAMTDQFERLVPFRTFVAQHL